MAYRINRKIFCLGILLCISNLSLANSSHNFYVTTLSILSYAKFSNPNPSFCVIDNPNIANQFTFFAQQNNYNLITHSINADELRSTYCDVVFFTSTPPNTQQQLLNKSLNKSILSFSTNNNECEIGSSFCLFTSKNGNTLFRVNLDSLAHSKIHIDPRVLLLAKSSE
ncbi:YfiR family protein [Acinetobacter sp. ANC 4648]|uniref:YfiR family protein n=1 Tax=Acinetobacter sp. ANC 4648 TaxID=1977875 RepID=UPI000A358CE0|nr:YfiR family protein [Acinetobacter sp. ANC 4648]OTG80008.1 hypothetical protein B9T27_13640 [Acinetobacter sp. ANC 4648]